MKPATATALFVAAVVLAVLAWDVAALAAWGEAATVSAVVRGWGERFSPHLPALAAAGMVLLWFHLFG